MWNSDITCAGLSLADRMCTQPGCRSLTPICQTPGCVCQQNHKKCTSMVIYSELLAGINRVKDQLQKRDAIDLYYDQIIKVCTSEVSQYQQFKENLLYSKEIHHFQHLIQKNKCEGILPEDVARIQAKTSRILNSNWEDVMKEIEQKIVEISSQFKALFKDMRSVWDRVKKAVKAYDFSSELCQEQGLFEITFNNDVVRKREDRYYNNGDIRGDGVLAQPRINPKEDAEISLKMISIFQDISLGIAYKYTHPEIQEQLLRYNVINSNGVYSYWNPDEISNQYTGFRCKQGDMIQIRYNCDMSQLSFCNLTSVQSSATNLELRIPKGCQLYFYVILLNAQDSVEIFKDP